MVAMFWELAILQRSFQQLTCVVLKALTKESAMRGSAR